MTTLTKKSLSYSNAGYWFLLFLVLSAAGFYHSYFLVIFQPDARIVHIHFTLVVLWVVMLIAQPFLIKYKKLNAHRAVGKISYVITPLLLLSCFLMMKYGYAYFMETMSQQLRNGNASFTSGEIRHQAAINFAMSVQGTLLLALFYGLAIFYRKHPAAHARYMVAASLTLLSPTVNRIIFVAFQIEIFPLHIQVETVAFLLTDSILIILLIADTHAKKDNKAIAISLAIYVIGQLIYYTGKDTMEWEQFMTWIMNA